MSDNELSEDSLKLLSAFFTEMAGEPEQKVNMWSTGKGLGLDRDQTQNRTMGLAAAGLLEILSLSGKVILTEEGLNKASGLTPDNNHGGSQSKIGELARDLQILFPRIKPDLKGSQDFQIDIKVLEAQAGRSETLAPVCQATIKAILEALKGLTSPDENMVHTLESMLYELNP